MSKRIFTDTLVVSIPATALFQWIYGMLLQAIVLGKNMVIWEDLSSCLTLTCGTEES